MISLIKHHTSSRITIGGLSSNLEESIRVCLNQAKEVDPPSPNDGKARVFRVWQKEKHVPGNKKGTDTLEKSKHVVVNVIIIFVGSISLSFVKHALKTSKTTT